MAGPPPNLRRVHSHPPHKDVTDYRQFLTSNRVTLTRDFQPDAFLDRLRQRHFFSDEDAEDIASPYVHPTRRMKVGRLLDILTNKGPEAFYYFMELVGYEYPHIYEEIFQKRPNPPPSDYRRHRSSTLALEAQHTLSLIHKVGEIQRDHVNNELKLNNVVDALNFVEAEKKDLEREIAYLRQTELHYEHSKQKLKELDDEVRAIKDENRNLLRKIVSQRDEIDKLEALIHKLENSRDETEQMYGEARLQLEQHNHNEARLKENFEKERNMSKRLRNEIKIFSERTGSLNKWETVLQQLSASTAAQTQLEILKNDLEEERSLNKQLCEELDQTRDELDKEKEQREELHKRLLQAESESEKFELWGKQVERRRDEYFEKINELEKEKRHAEDECNKAHQRYLDEADKRKHLFDKNHTLELRVEHLQRELDEARQENRWNRPRLSPMHRPPTPRTPISPRPVDDPFAESFKEYAVPETPGSCATLPPSLGRTAADPDCQVSALLRTPSLPDRSGRSAGDKKLPCLTHLKIPPAVKPKTDSMKVHANSVRMKNEDDPVCYSGSEEECDSDSGRATSQHRSSTTSTASEEFSLDHQQPRKHHLSPAASFESDERGIDTSCFEVCEDILPEKPEKTLYYRLKTTNQKCEITVSSSCLKDVILTQDPIGGVVVSKGVGPIKAGDKIVQVTYGGSVIEMSKDRGEAAVQLRQCATIGEETVVVELLRKSRKVSSCRCSRCIPENKKVLSDLSAVKEVYIRSNITWENATIDRSIPIHEGEILYIQDQDQEKYFWTCKVERTSGRKFSRQVSGRIPSLQEAKKLMPELRPTSSLCDTSSPGPLGRKDAVRKKSKSKETWRAHPYVLVYPMKARKLLPVLLFGPRALVKAVLDALDSEASWAKVIHNDGESKAPHWNDLVSDDHHLVLPGNMSLTSRCLHCYVVITFKVMKDSKEAMRQIFGEGVELSDDEDCRTYDDLHQRLGIHGEQISLLITQKIKDKTSFLTALHDKVTKVQQQIFWIEAGWPDFQS